MIPKTVGAENVAEGLSEYEEGIALSELYCIVPTRNFFGATMFLKDLDRVKYN